MKMGVIRPDAELVKQYTYDKMLISDGVLQSLPSYSTNDNQILASGTLETLSTDADYDYFIQQRTLTIPIYNTDTFGDGRQEYDFSASCAEVFVVPANMLKALSDNTKSNSSAFVNVKSAFIWLLAYDRYSAVNYNQQTTINNFGFYQAPQTTPTATSSSITIKNPKFGVKGSSTYLNSTYWGYITDVRYQYVIDVYRAKKTSSDKDGWSVEENFLHTLNCAYANGHTLT